MVFSITPSTSTILGDSPRMPAAQPLQEHEEPRPRLSFWGRFKKKARRALDVLKDVLIFTKDVIVPIVSIVVPLVKPRCHFRQPRQKEGRFCVCVE